MAAPKKKPAPRKRKPANPDDAIVAKNVKARKVEWLWRERIPAGMIAIVAGRPDQGKGLFAAHVTAAVSKAGGNVIHSAIEDDHALMTQPRLVAAGADLNRVLLWRFSVPSQIEELEARVTKLKVRLVVMDPFSAHLSGGVSRYSDSIRKVTTPLSKMAERTGTTILIVEHALKKVAKNSHPLSAIGGNSSGLPAAARAAFIFGVDPQDADRRILCSVKANLRDTPKALVFESDTEEVGMVGEVPLLVPQGETEFDARRLLGDDGTPSKIGRRPDKRAEACEWITQYLASAGKPVKAGTVMEDAKQYGLTSGTVRRACQDMKIVINPPGGGRTCTWDLPNDIKKALGAGPQKIRAAKK